MDSILAYHIIWVAYGTWLSVNHRGWVKKGQWAAQPPNPNLEQRRRTQMVEPVAVLSESQRDIVRQTIVDHCRIRKWTLHEVKVLSNHVHAIITADCDGLVVRDQLKAWCSRRLSDAAGLQDTVGKKAGRRHWFTEGGDVEHIYDETHLNNAINYVRNQ